MTHPHCPHCLLPVDARASLPYPPQAMRCPHCRLLIGAGRARSGAAEDGDARSRGSAAGVLANAARREHGEAIDHGTVIDALEDRNLSTGLVTLCIGGGMGIATIVERV